MKNRLLLILFSLIGLFSFGQVHNNSNDYSFKGSINLGKGTSSYTPTQGSSWLEIGPSGTSKALILPRVNDTSVIVTPTDGMIIHSLGQNKTYVRRLGVWTELTYTALGGFLNISDTATMLSAYTRLQRVQDSLTAIRGRINGAGVLVTAAQPNITLLGTLSAVTVTGNLTAGGVISNGGVLSYTLNSVGVVTLADAGAGSLSAGTYYIGVVPVSSVGGEGAFDKAGYDITNSITISGSHNITASWLAVPGAVAYRVYVRYTNSGYYLRYYETTNTSYTVSVQPAGLITPPVLTTSQTGGNLTAGNYYFAVSANFSDGQTTGQTPITDFPISTITSDVGSVGMTWASVTGATSYNVFVISEQDGNFRIYTKYFTTPTNSITVTGNETYVRGLGALPRGNRELETSSPLVGSSFIQTGDNKNFLSADAGINAMKGADANWLSRRYDYTAGLFGGMSIGVGTHNDWQWGEIGSDTIMYLKNVTSNNYPIKVNPSTSLVTFLTAKSSYFLVDSTYFIQNLNRLGFSGVTTLESQSTTKPMLIGTSEIKPLFLYTNGIAAMKIDSVQGITTYRKDNYANAIALDPLTKIYKQASDSLYAPISSSGYLPLTGGTLSGQLNGTSLAMSGVISSAGLTITNGITAASETLTGSLTAAQINSTGLLGGTLSTAAQTNVTSLGTLTSLTVTGSVSASSFNGNLVATNVTGTLLTAAQPNITSLGTLTGLTSSGIINAKGAEIYLDGSPTSNGSGYLYYYTSNSAVNWKVSTNDNFAGDIEFSPSTAGTKTWQSPVLRLTSTGIIALKPIKLASYTVATLPSCAAGDAGTTLYVSDALTLSFGTVLVGGGSNGVIGLCNGTSWVQH